MTTPVCASCGRPVGDGAVGHGIIAGPLGRSTRWYCSPECAGGVHLCDYQWHPSGLRCRGTGAPCPHVCDTHGHALDPLNCGGCLVASDAVYDATHPARPENVRHLRVVR